METSTSILMKYWVASDRPEGFPDLEGIEEFRNELANDHISVVRGRPSGAGGLVYIVVNFVSTLPLSHVVQLLIDGVAYDLLKEGSKSFVLRPFITAYKRLRDRNRQRRLYLSELTIEFQESQLVLHEVSLDTVVDNLEAILQFFASHYERLKLQSGEAPTEIHVPVVEDTDNERPCRFRVLAHVEEEITGKGPEDYLGFWGLVYGRDLNVKVYDARNQNVLDERFNTVEEHWRDLERRTKRKYGG